MTGPASVPSSPPSARPVAPAEGIGAPVGDAVIGVGSSPATTTANAGSANRPAPDKIRTLAAARRFFMGKATPRLMVAMLLGLVVLRVRAGFMGWTDLTIVLLLLAFEPFTEWLIHVFVLHFKPRRLGRLPVDLHAAKKHRYHHRHPNDPHTAFVPLVDLVGLGTIVVLAFALVTRGDTGHLLTAMIAATAMLFVYEWTHFLIHTPYQPQGRYYRYIWRAHRLHHFKNEHYWMGVTVHLADHLFATFPAKADVENSPTARTLGVGVDEET